MKTTAFYYWRSTFQLSATEQQAIQVNDCQQLYVKYMDVDVENGQAIPVASIRFEAAIPKGIEVIPCVFITNRTFEARISPKDLAQKVWPYLQQINQAQGLTPQAYQFDCDWTASTQKAYFEFLKQIKAMMRDETLSATLRLHQFRYSTETGVPPVDEVSLMCYNMGDIESPTEINSIMNWEKAVPYLDAKSAYPLPMDLALPVFSWVLDYRLGELNHILYLSDLAVLDTLSGIKKLSDNQYELIQNLYLGGHYLNEGDQLRVEQPAVEDLQKAYEWVQKQPNFSGTLIFYHLNEPDLQHYPVALGQFVRGENSGY
ncbi:MAG TPA: hypothetical protein PKA00_07215 [Saprospiraceae bacterium]|nr:hypothetical protein [Saprospiraceae bacterium]HMQ82679.1 hypothetical protein [Saprospiraceae bacterium]